MTTYLQLTLSLQLLVAVVVLEKFVTCFAWYSNNKHIHIATRYSNHQNRSRNPTPKNFYTMKVLSSDYFENDIVSVIQQQKDKDQKNDSDSSSSLPPPRLCVVRPDNTVMPLCQHEDDVETDLFLDPRCENDEYWIDKLNLLDDDKIVKTYGEGWYGQRPVPSLGGGPGYGAQADEIWTLDVSVLEEIQNDNVDLPILDVGIAHGEKARGGALF